MAKNLLAAVVCFGVMSASAAAAGPQGVDALMQRYDAADVAEGKIQVSASGDLAYVTGISPDGPWLEVWRLTSGRWKMVADIAMSEIAPIRFGVTRGRPCRRTS